MKRSPLNRSSKPMKRSPLKRMSDKKRQEKSATDKHRAFYVANCVACEMCEVGAAEHCHEITAGSSRHRAVYLANTWLGLCAACHRELQGEAFEHQFNLKCLAVRRDINRALGRDAI